MGKTVSEFFPQPDVQAADTCGGVCGEVGSFQVRIVSFQFRECLPPGTLLSERWSGSKRSEMRISIPEKDTNSSKSSDLLGPLGW